MKEKFIENGIEYILCGDYYLLNLTLEKSKFSNYSLGKYRKYK